jgi:hypothetical protein
MSQEIHPTTARTWQAYRAAVAPLYAHPGFRFEARAEAGVQLDGTAALDEQRAPRALLAGRSELAQTDSGRCHLRRRYSVQVAIRTRDLS